MRGFYENRSYYSTIPVTVTKTRNMDFLAHWHTDVEIIYVCEGALRMGINKESRLIHEGDVAVCGSRDIHFYDSKGLDSTVIMVIFRPEFIDCTGNWPKDSRFKTPFISGAVPEIPGIDTGFFQNLKNIFHTLHKEMRQQNNCYEMVVKSKLLELCASLLRHIPSIPIDAEKEYRLYSGIKIMQEILKFIENNYREDINFEDAAKRVNISPFYFSRLFKRISGMSFKSFLNSIRIEKAEDIITYSDKPIIDIAFECGFNSVRTFNRAFKTIKGYTPSSVRRQHYMIYG